MESFCPLSFNIDDYPSTSNSSFCGLYKNDDAQKTLKGSSKLDILESTDFGKKYNFKMFRKSEYYDILKTQRSAFVNEHFLSDIETISKQLKEDAEKMKVCNITHFFNVSDMFDISKVDNILQEYFRDCGYHTVSTREDKENSKIIKIALS